MRGPVSEETDVAHEITHRGALMLRHEISHGAVEMEGSGNRYHRNDDADQPVENSGPLHNKVPVSFGGRYFERALEIRNTQFCFSVFRFGPFSSGRHVELTVDRSRRAAFRGGIARDDPARKLRRSLFQ